MRQPLSSFTHPPFLGRARITYLGALGETVLETELIDAEISITDAEVEPESLDEPPRRKISIELRGEVPKSAQPLNINTKALT